MDTQEKLQVLKFLQFTIPNRKRQKSFLLLCGMTAKNLMIIKRIFKHVLTQVLLKKNKINL